MGKTAVVTGAGQGIGKSIAITLADAGYNLILVDINAISLDELKEKFGLEVENDENREVEHLLD